MFNPKFPKGISALRYWFEHGDEAREYSLPAVFLDENEVCTTPPPQVFDYPDWWYVWVDLDKLVQKLTNQDKYLIGYYFGNIYNNKRLFWHTWKRKEDFKDVCNKFYYMLPEDYQLTLWFDPDHLLKNIRQLVAKGEIDLEAIKPDFFYTAQEVAYILRYSDQTIHELLKSGKLKGVKIGQWRIKGSHLLEFINQGFQGDSDE
jgi:excisionase family DNA binding protein